MKKQLFTLALLLVTLTVGAQDKILEKYSAMGDVSTVSVSRGMIDRLTDEQREFFSSEVMSAIADKVDHIKILSSDKLKAAKMLSNKLPKQLLSNGYAEVTTTKQGGAKVQILQSKKNPDSMVFVITDGPKTTVASVKGNFR